MMEAKFTACDQSQSVNLQQILQSACYGYKIYLKSKLFTQLTVLLQQLISLIIRTRVDLTVILLNDCVA